jgi:hypothetical protein
LLALAWLLEHRPDADELRFLRWWPVAPVADNPLTHEPANLVRVTLETKDFKGQLAHEDLLVFLKGDQILGVRHHDPPAVDVIGPAPGRVVPRSHFPIVPTLCSSIDAASRIS